MVLETILHVARLTAVPVVIVPNYQEDRKMVELVGLFGPKRWSAISQRFPGRIGKQCRER